MDTHPYLYSVLSGVEAQYFRAYSLPQHQDRFARISTNRDSSVVAVGAHAVHLPFGFALAEIRNDQSAELLSLFVKEKHRRKGIGRRMLTLLERELSDRGAQELHVYFERGRRYTASVEPFLNATGFATPDVYGVSCRCLFDHMKDAPWMKRPRAMPSAFEIFFWKDLGDEDRRDILQRQQESAWFPIELSPFAGDGGYEPLNSLGLRYAGEVVGWQINRRVARDTIQYAITFVRADLQPLGLGALLMMESSRIQVERRDPALDKAYFRVPHAMRGMIAYVENRLKPYVDEINDCMRTRKRLGEVSCEDSRTGQPSSPGEAAV